MSNERLSDSEIDELQITLLRLAMKLGNDELESKFANLCAQAKSPAVAGVAVASRLRELAHDAEYANDFMVRHQLYDVGLKTLGTKLRALSDEIAAPASPNVPAAPNGTVKCSADTMRQNEIPAVVAPAQGVGMPERVGYLWIMNNGMPPHVMLEPFSDDDGMYSAPITGYKDSFAIYRACAHCLALAKGRER